mmetsp:Transcript_17528/g.44945  ORF Transcript_17528/g.44945 Transcript_17528/m.44945 type:complete len:108 (+) Transcript_17528:1712-2035(+)
MQPEALRFTDALAEPALGDDGWLCAEAAMPAWPHTGCGTRASAAAQIASVHMRATADVRKEMVDEKIVATTLCAAAPPRASNSVWFHAALEYIAGQPDCRCVRYQHV